MNKEFKPGQKWIMRNGEIATIDSVDEFREFPVRFSVPSLKHSALTARLTGRYMSNGKSDYDLMELAAEPAAKFKAGQRWVMRSGEFATIEEVNTARNYPVLYSFPSACGKQTRTARMNGRHSDKHETQVDLMRRCDTCEAPEQPLDAFLQAARNDLVEQALRFAEIADSVAAKRNWESVVKLKLLTAMLQQVIEHEGTL